MEKTDEKKGVQRGTPPIDAAFRVFRPRGSELRSGKILASNDLQLLILQMLSESPRHGYELMKEIRQLASGVYVPSPGLVYPVLTSLERSAYAESATTGIKKLFTITAQGSRYLDDNREKATAVFQSLRRYGQKVAHLERDVAQEEATAESWGGGPYAHNNKAWRELSSAFVEIRHELKAALFSKMDSSLEEKQRVLHVLRNAIAAIRGNE